MKLNRDPVPTGTPVSEPRPTGSEPPSGVRQRVAAAKSTADTSAPNLLAFIANEAPSAETLAHRFGVSLPDAEEIRQDTLEAMIKSPEPIRSPLAWFWETASRRMRRLLVQKARAKKGEPAMQMLGEQQSSPFPAPDARLERRDRERAVEGALARVKPSRRRVAELRMAGYDEAEVADELKLRVGTVRSQWARAKEDARHWLAALIAALVALWLRVVRRERYGAAVPAGARSRGTAALFACAALPIAITTHTGAELPMVDRSFEEGSDMASASEWSVFAPVLHTNAEREREAGSALRPVAPDSDSSGMHAPDRASGRSSASARSENAERNAAASRAPLSAARLESARAHLVTVHRAIFVEGDRDQARQMLELYALTFPENPFPSKYAELSAALRAP